MKSLAAWKIKAGQLREDLFALYFAMGDRRTPWYARVLLAVIIGYAVSPIDIIPDFIPVLGYLDDILLVPAGIFLAVKLIPQQVMADSRARVKDKRIPRKAGWIAAGAIIFVWLAAAYGIFLLVTA